MPDLYLEYEILSEIEKKLFYYWYQTADLVVDRVFILGYVTQIRGQNSEGDRNYLESKKKNEKL